MDKTEEKNWQIFISAFGLGVLFTGLVVFIVVGLVYLSSV